MVEYDKKLKEYVIKSEIMKEENQYQITLSESQMMLISKNFRRCFKICIWSNGNAKHYSRNS